MSTHTDTTNSLIEQNKRERNREKRTFFLCLVKCSQDANYLFCEVVHKNKCATNKRYISQNFPWMRIFSFYNFFVFFVAAARILFISKWLVNYARASLLLANQTFFLYVCFQIVFCLLCLSLKRIYILRKMMMMGKEFHIKIVSFWWKITQSAETTINKVSSDNILSSQKKRNKCRHRAPERLSMIVNFNYILNISSN